MYEDLNVCILHIWCLNLINTIFLFFLTVEACKERWKNLRAGLARHLRQLSSVHLSGTKRPYYLAEYMQFLVPFLNRNKRNTINPDHELPLPNGYEPEMDFKVESNDAPYPEEDQEQVSENITCSPESILFFRPENAKYMSSNERNTIDRNNADRHIVDRSSPECSFSRKRRCTISSDDFNFRRSVDDPDLCFFKSLLPDVRKMSDSQKHCFRMMVLNNINDILYKN